MIKDFHHKKQVIEDKIHTKYLLLKEQEERKERVRLFDQENYSSYQPEEEQEKVQDFQQAMENYMESMNYLKDYLDQYEENGDGEYLHKLLFDFYKAQAICENMKEDEQQLELYKKFQKPTHQQDQQDSGQGYEEVKYDPFSLQEMEKKMTMRDKLKMGKFCSYKQIGQNQIEDYRSISSQEEILQGEMDVIEDFFQRQKDRRETNKIKYAQRRHKERLRRESNKIAKMLKNTKYSEQYGESSQDEYIDQESIQIHRFKMQQREKIARKLKEQRQNRQKIKKRHKKPSQDEDSSNQVQFDSLQSDSDFSDRSSDDDSGQDSNEGEYECEEEESGYEEHFKHLDIYEQMDDLEEGDDYDYLMNSAIFNSGKEKIIHGKQSYHYLNKAQAEKFFKRRTREYKQSLLEMIKQKKKQSKHDKKSSNKNVTFSDAIFYKSFNSDAKPQQVSFADEKQEVVVKAIWQYDD